MIYDAQWRAMPRRFGATRQGKRGLTRVPESVLRDFQYRFEVCSVLECHAIYQAAASTTRDVRNARSVLTSLNQVMLAADAAEWNRLDVEFHRTLNDQCGNLVLAAAVEGIHRDLQANCARYLGAPVDHLETLWLLQSHHLKILGCVERGQPEEGVLQTRAHLHSMQNSVVAALYDQGRAGHVGRRV
jgi:DNA-binding GntR family transcriptional regulator